MENKSNLNEENGAFDFKSFENELENVQNKVIWKNKELKFKRQIICMEKDEDKGIIKNAETYKSNKVQYYINNTDHYFYHSEGVKDYGWGCAYRSLQTALFTLKNLINESSEKEKYELKYKKLMDSNLTFKDIFYDYGSKKVLGDIIIKMLNVSELPEYFVKKDFAPFETENAWIEPYISQVICYDLEVYGELFLVNKYSSEAIAPEFVFNQTNKTNFSEIREVLINYFKQDNNLKVPVIIDDGLYSFAIIGVGIENDDELTKDFFYLFIADPHIRDDEKGSDGLYEVMLDKNGKYIKRDCDTFRNCKEFNFDEKMWMLLFLKV